MRSIASPQPQFFRIVYPILLCSCFPTSLESQITPPPPQFCTTLFRFYFLNRIHVSFSTKYRQIHLFSQDSYSSLLFSKWTYAPPPPYPTQYVWSWLYSISTSLSSYLYHWPQLPIPPHIPSLDEVKPMKQMWHQPMFNIFERIRRVPHQSGEPYLKETKPP